ncbi:cytochrome P450 [Aquihabitans sp. McL0605]|uniref:cytochrome P450 n=1 Tax=Aquihabitans sp. McL0605 TaxID=3415671 RepID=UPI003CEAFF0A
MDPAPSVAPITDDWRAHHFDHLSPALAQDLHDTLTHMREDHPVTWSEEHGGFWVVTRHADVLAVAQDWAAFSSAQGVSIPKTESTVVAIPEHIDPPLQKSYRQVINAYFTPQAVARFEPDARALVTRLIDGFVETGSCDFLAEFARPFPGLAFFELILNAPADTVASLNETVMAATNPNNPERGQAWVALNTWIAGFVADRRREPAQGDVVDAILGATIDDRPITEPEIIGMIQLLILGGLDTTAGALGQFMLRFADDPAIPELLRHQPDAIPRAVEELLRLDGPFIAIARTATRDVEVGGQPIAEGDKVLIYWASANRDEAEFPCPHAFDIDRTRNRHLAFGAGPHRCAGSNLARMNLRVAVEELTRRLVDVRLQDGAAPIEFHSVLNRVPLSVPITFTPGPRRS